MDPNLYLRYIFQYWENVLEVDYQVHIKYEIKTVEEENIRKTHSRYCLKST